MTPAASATHDRQAPAPPTPTGAGSSSGGDTEAGLRRRVAELEDQIARLADLIGCKNPDKIEHDLRNVLNELVLLRKLTEDM